MFVLSKKGSIVCITLLNGEQYIKSISNSSNKTDNFLASSIPSSFKDVLKEGLLKRFSCLKIYLMANIYAVFRGQISNSSSRPFFRIMRSRNSKEALSIVKLTPSYACLISASIEFPVSHMILSASPSLSVYCLTTIELIASTPKPLWK